LLIKTNGDPINVVPGVRAAIQELDPEIPLFAASSLESATTISLLPMRIAATIASALGIIALALGSIGIYGIVSFMVRNRTREIGIRIALGAQPSHVIRTVNADILRWTTIGLTLGLGASLAISELLHGVIYGVAAADAVSFGGVAILLLLTGYVACWIPARRATHIDPLSALREE
jgi:ABC-type antimicrobial peptide transport system permease subunit